MSLWRRFTVFIKAKFSRILDNAEDPNETLDYAYQKQLEQLQKVKQGIADMVTAKKRTQMQGDKLRAQVAKLGEQAKMALQAGNEDLARQALTKKTFIQSELDGIDSQVAELEASQAKLVESEKNLRQKIDAFRTKKEVIKAQYSAAEAQVRISEAATGVGGEMQDAGMAMQRAVDKVDNMKARAGAMEELEAAGALDNGMGLGVGEDDIDRQLRELTSSSTVDSELSKLRTELGVAEPVATLDAAPVEEGTPLAEPAPQETA